MLKLADIRKEFEKYIVIKDPYILDIVLATLVGNALVPGDPVWTMIVAPSSGGKTTFLSPCVAVPSVHFIDDLTEKTFLSGYKVKGKEMSLLKTIGSGVLAFSDFTSILAKNPVSRGEILTQFKLIYDGKLTKHTGIGGIVWEGKMGFLGAATPDIYSYLETGRSMGERFIYYWLDQPTDDEVVAKQQEANISAKEIADKMKVLYEQYCKDIRDYVAKHGVPPLKMTEEQRLAVREAAIFCVNGKSTVHTDFKTGKVDQIPNKAGAGRDNKSFITLLQTLQLMDAYEIGMIDRPVQDNRIELIQKSAYSSINRERRKIMEILVEANGSMLSGSKIGTDPTLGFEKESAEKYLIPLHAVGLIRKKAGNPHQWYIDDEKTIKFIKNVKDKVKDMTPLRNVEEEVSSGNPDIDELNNQMLDDFDNGRI